MANEDSMTVNGNAGSGVHWGVVLVMATAAVQVTLMVFAGMHQ